jgi:two-component system sensor histidine kinase MprB
MSFRRRVVLLAAGAVAAAIVIASVVVYVVTGNELHARIDTSLRQKLTPGRAQAVQIRTVNIGAGELAKLIREGKLPPGATAPIGFGRSVARLGLPRGAVVAGGSFCAKAVLHSLETTYAGKSSGAFLPGESAPARPARPPHCVAPVNRLVLPPPTPGSDTGYVQLFQANGQVLRSETKGLQLPVTAATRAVAAGRHGAFFSEATVAGTPLRILTKRAPEGGVWQVALPLTDVDNTLTHLKLVLALVCLGGIALAAALGLLVSRTALIPVRRLTGAAERVARTQDLGHRIQAGEDDELGRLAQSFNTMLAALERSRLAQRQLVSDASHELRTPLTSVQANLDALALSEELPTRERARILTAAQAQLRELTVLVGDLVDLSKTEVEEVEVEDVRLDLAAAGALRRARLHAPECPIVLDAEPSSCGPRRRGWIGRSRTYSTTPANGTRRPVTVRMNRRAAPSKCACATARSRSATTVRASPRRISPACSTASTAHPARGGDPDRGLGLRSCAKWPRLTVDRCTPPTIPAVAPA